MTFIWGHPGAAFPSQHVWTCWPAAAAKVPSDAHPGDDQVLNTLRFHSQFTVISNAL